MGFISEDFNTGEESVQRLDAVTAMTKLLLHELESMRRSSSALDSFAGRVGPNLNEQVQRYEVTLICNALLESRGNQSQAAKRLGIKNSTLHAKIRRYKIDSSDLFSESGI